MNEEKSMDQHLLRLLRDELDRDAAAELRARLEGQPALRARFESLRESWEALDLPEVEVPPGFASRVLAAAGRSRLAAPASARLTPVWARATGAAALVAGIVLGVVLTPKPNEPEIAAMAEPLSLAESYLAMLELPPGEAANWSEESRR